MLDFFLQLYVNNNTLTDIRNFAENYRPEDAINWYTKESFVYRCINQTLRSGDIDKIYFLRFYIADLSAQLRILKYQQQKLMEKAGTIVLYRGIRQTDEELKELQNLVGHVVAVKSFMSTSRNKEIALTYASPTDSQAENSRSVLIEIHVDLSLPAINAADITRISNFNEENEVLFDIGSIFRIDMVTFDKSSGVWVCRFIATNENLECLENFQTIPFNKSLSQLILRGNDEMTKNKQSNYINKNFISISNDRQKLSWIAYKPIDCAYIRHINCIIKWQQTDINELWKTCERVLEIYAQANIIDSFDDLQIATCMNNYGHINLSYGKDTQLIELFKSSLNIRKRYLPQDHILLAQSYRNLGLAYANLFDYHTAFQLHECALNINQHASIAAQWSTVTTLRNMGQLCHQLRYCAGAIEYYSKAINTHSACLNFLTQHN